MPRYPCIAFALLLALSAMAVADRPADISLPIWQRGSGGYYVRGVFSGDIETDLLIDTGSSYVVLSRDTFAKLRRGNATPLRRTIRGATATGRVLEVNVYSIAELALGDDCVLRDVEAVVVPGANRDILGLSALRRLQPIVLQLESAMMTVTACAPSTEPMFAETPAARGDGR